MLLWNTATGDLFHKTMLHSFIPYKGNHLKIHPKFSTQRLSKAPIPQKRGRGVSIVSHSHQACWAAMGTAQAQMSVAVQAGRCSAPAELTIPAVSIPSLLKCTQARLSWSAQTTPASLKKNLSNSWKRQILPRMNVAGEAHSWTQGRRILTQAMVQM